MLCLASAWLMVVWPYSITPRCYRNAFVATYDALPLHVRCRTYAVERPDFYNQKLPRRSCAHGIILPDRPRHTPLRVCTRLISWNLGFACLGIRSSALQPSSSSRCAHIKSSDSAAQRKLTSAAERRRILSTTTSTMNLSFNMRLALLLRLQWCR